MRVPLAPQFLAAVLLPALALISTASAQDAMQRDTAFKDSLLRKPAPEERVTYQDGQRDANGPHQATSGLSKGRPPRTR